MYLKLTVTKHGNAAPAYEVEGEINPSPEDLEMLVRVLATVELAGKVRTTPRESARQGVVIAQEFHASLHSEGVHSEKTIDEG